MKDVYNKVKEDFAISENLMKENEKKLENCKDLVKSYENLKLELEFSRKEVEVLRIHSSNLETSEKNLKKLLSNVKKKF